ncbi:MAG: hypothetical protein ACI9S8_002068 [Chlamydiales bacterium]|jgi:hypothetical protein
MADFEQPFTPVFDRERLKLNPASEMDIQPIELGDNKYPAILVDNFYRDPDYIREIALNSYYRPDPRTAYPGTVSSISLGAYDICDFLYPKLGFEYAYSQKSFRESSGNYWKFSLVGSGVNDPKLQIEHTDPNLLQGLVFLNPPELCKGGTVFFKHKDYEIEEIVNNEEVSFLALNKLGSLTHAGANKTVDSKALDYAIGKGVFSQYLNLQKGGILNSYFDLMKIVTMEYAPTLGHWEETKIIEMKYNRLICFPGFLVHALRCESAWFGDSLEKRRLTQNFNFGWPLLT